MYDGQEIRKEIVVGKEWGNGVNEGVYGFCIVHCDTII